MDSVNVREKVTRKNTSGWLLVLTDSPWIMWNARREQTFPPPTASECAQPGGGSGLEGRIGMRAERKREKRERGVVNRKLDEKIEERVSSEEVQTSVMSELIHELIMKTPFTVKGKKSIRMS